MPRTKRVLAYFTWSSPALGDGVRAYARDADWMLVFPSFSHGIPEASTDFDGVLVLVGKSLAFNAKERFPRAKIVDLEGTADLKADAIVMNDQAQVGCMAADHLHGLGYRQFLGLTFHEAATVNARLAGFERRLSELGMPFERFHCDMASIKDQETAAHFNAQVKALIARLGTPLAIFCPEDVMADFFLQELLSLGYRIPEDVVILGANNDRSCCEACRVPLSSVDTNLFRTGFEAAKLLDRLMKGEKDIPRLTLIPPLMVEGRRSTDRLSSQDKLVAAILRYIRAHFSERINVEDVARAVHTSRSVAYERFRRAMGRSIGEEIENVRIEHAWSLLSSTDYKIDVVARLCGYMDTSAFCRAFKKRTSETPTDFRNKGLRPQRFSQAEQ